MASSAWKSIVKKVNSMNNKFPGSSVVCIGLIDNQYVVAGSDEMKDLFLKKPEIEALYKGAVLSQSFNDQPVQEADVPGVELAVRDILQQHVYDMDTGLMRSVLAAAVSPEEAISNKDGRRNFYVEENCPRWWKDTGIPFQSVNHAPGGSKRLPKVSLMVLLESLQRSLGIMPMAPKKHNRTAFTSSFIYSDNATTEQEQQHDQQEEQQHDHQQEQQHDQQQEQQDQQQQEQHDQQQHEQHDQQQQEQHDQQQWEQQHDQQQQEQQQDQQQQDQQQQDQQPQDQQQQDQQQRDQQQQDQQQQDQQQTASKQTNRRNIVLKILDEELSWEEKSLKVMRQFTSWDDILSLSDLVLGKLPPIPAQLSDEWHSKPLKDVHKNYADYIPLSIGERVVFQSTPNGNCIYNAISIIYFGDESMAMTIKLASVLQMVDDLVPFTKYIVEEFKENTNFWIQAATRTENDVSTAEGVERCCMMEMLDTLKHPYKDGCIFHLHLLAHLLGRPIQQHCSKNYEQYQQMLFPPLHEFKSPAAIHLVWVPAKPRNKYASINHVVPAVCHLSPYGCHLEECALLGVGVCAFMHNFNSKESYGWVECTLCGQWVHDKCMNVNATQYSSNDDFPCGCDTIRNGRVPLRSVNYYTTLENLDYDFKAIVKNVSDSISLRNDLFRREGHGRLKFSLRFKHFGPFTDDFIDYVNCCLYKVVKPTEHALVPDIYLPEVLLKIIQEKEKINRLLAEMVLKQKV